MWYERHHINGTVEICTSNKYFYCRIYKNNNVMALIYSVLFLIVPDIFIVVRKWPALRITMFINRHTAVGVMGRLEVGHTASRYSKCTAYWIEALHWRYMGVMTFKITGNSTVCLTACLDYEQTKYKKHALLTLWDGNPLLNGGGFPLQRVVVKTSNFWWGMWNSGHCCKCHTDTLSFPVHVIHSKVGCH